MRKPAIEPLRNRLGWLPQERQAAFLEGCGVLDWYLHDGPVTQPAAKLLGYGGAAGGGKTDAFLGLAIIMCYAFPGCKVSIFRRTYDELDGPDGAIQRSQALFSGLGKYNESKHRWEFEDVHSFIFFRHCQHEKDRTKYQSQQFHVLLIDEATHFSWLIVDYLLTRNRSTVAGLVPFAAMASNPGGVGHIWYSELFDVQDISGGQHGPHGKVKRQATANGKYEDVYFIPAKLEDNQILMTLDPDYARKLESRGSDLVEALRYGNWQVFAGQVFRTWRRERYVIRPFLIPEHWPKWRATDWGYVAPWCTLWMARDPDRGRIYVYREMYRTMLTDTQQARLIRENTSPAEAISIHYADPSMWTNKSRDDIEYSTADEYAKEGIYLTRAGNDRIQGKRKVDSVLADLVDGMPGLQVFETCTNLIRTLPLLVYDGANIEDVDTNQEDHAYDTLRYGLTNYQIYAYSKPQEERDLLAESYNPMEDIGQHM